MSGARSALPFCIAIASDSTKFDDTKLQDEIVEALRVGTAS
jgi:hypothetical protein